LPTLRGRKPIRLFFVIAFDHPGGVERDPSGDARVLDFTDQIVRHFAVAGVMLITV
jgi:hypothetical protein